MLGETNFGEFITVMRKREKIKLRTFSEMLSLSPAYVSQVENGKRPAPSLETQRRMAALLNLNEEEEIVFYDLAAQTKKKSKIPADIAIYIENDGALLRFLRTAKRLGFTGEGLLDLLNRKPK